LMSAPGGTSNSAIAKTAGLSERWRPRCSRKAFDHRLVAYLAVLPAGHPNQTHQAWTPQDGADSRGGVQMFRLGDPRLAAGRHPSGRPAAGAWWTTSCSSSPPARRRMAGFARGLSPIVPDRILGVVLQTVRRSKTPRNGASQDYATTAIAREHEWTGQLASRVGARPTRAVPARFTEASHAPCEGWGLPTPRRVLCSLSRCCCWATCWLGCTRQPTGRSVLRRVGRVAAGC